MTQVATLSEIFTGERGTADLDFRESVMRFLGPPDDQFNRMLFATTSIDEADMASAATSGVTYPAIASGTVKQL